MNLIEKLSIIIGKIQNYFNQRKAIRNAHLSKLHIKRMS
jgi:hypothetical protein